VIVRAFRVAPPRDVNQTITLIAAHRKDAAPALNRGAAQLIHRVREVQTIRPILEIGSRQSTREWGLIGL
jgi:hypothetical protein